MIWISFILIFSLLWGLGNAVQIHTSPQPRNEPSKLSKTYVPDPNSPDFLPPARKSLSLEMTPDGLHFLLPAFIGTPPQKVRLIIDTGSAELMLLNRSYCKQHQEDYNTHDCYLPAASTSFVHTGDTSSFQLQVSHHILELLSGFIKGRSIHSFCILHSSQSIYPSLSCHLHNIAVNIMLCFSCIQIDGELVNDLATAHVKDLFQFQLNLAGTSSPDFTQDLSRPSTRFHLSEQLSISGMYRSKLKGGLFRVIWTNLEV